MAEFQVTERLPIIGETVYFWANDMIFDLEAIDSRMVSSVEIPDETGQTMAYVVVWVAYGSGSRALHGINPVVKNDRDDWFFSLKDCQKYVQSEIDRRKVALLK